MTNKPFKIYIAGKITGNEVYKQQFAELEEWLKCVYPNVMVINPAVLPQGLSRADYARIYISMIDSADIVVFDSDIGDSKGSQLEIEYCDYINKPYVIMHEEFDSKNYCPECGKPVEIEGACGEHFIIRDNPDCPCCGHFNIFRVGDVDELNCWEVYKAMWIAEMAKNHIETTECEWVDDWMNHPFYKCASCRNVFVGKANYCDNCGKKITGERGSGSGNMAE